MRRGTRRSGGLLRRRWKVTSGARKVTLAELEWRVETGLWQVILRHGRYRGVRQKADNSALLALVRRSGVASLRGSNARGGQVF